MEDYNREFDENSHEVSPEPGGGRSHWLIAAVITLAIVVGVAFGYGYQQQTKVGHLAAQQTMATATISDLQRQLDATTAKMNDLVAQQQAAAQAAAEKAKATANTAGGKRAARGPSAADKRYKQLEAQITEQQKQLKDTQDLVAKNRSDLEGSLSSTRDELNGSIAKTHEELVTLAKRGERSYFEFDLEKSKQFQRFGPITISLRKADTKHENYDMQMIVDDNTLTKKKVNLYEPIWIHTENESQPVQVVVNRISKNHVHGYVSAPKYKPSELAAVGSATATPVSTRPQSPDASSQTPKEPEPEY
jgi:hypothetical protein